MRRLHDTRSAEGEDKKMNVRTCRAVSLVRTLVVQDSSPATGGRHALPPRRLPQGIMCIFRKRGPF